MPRLHGVGPFALGFLLIAQAVHGAAPLTGEQLYRAKCASCHGATGEGVPKKYEKPLIGDKTVPVLAKYIAKSMPEDDPGSMSAEDSAKVAAWMHEAFYSPAAQDRNKPPRVELSRLTVTQYRNAVADLVGSFRTHGKWDETRGLRGEYFDARNFRNDKRIIERIDKEVSFNFGVTGPAPDKFEANQFCIRWNGAVLAPETGDYEFIVRTEHAARLWVNDINKPLIDAWVKSGNDIEYKGSLFLVGGRAYPLRLEFSKAKQGVDDSKKNKNPPPAVKASVALWWKQPQRAPEVIPGRCLSPNKFPETFVSSTAFPPDDRSLGWERGNTVSKAWESATTDAAIETAGYVAAHVDELALGMPVRLRDTSSGNPSQINLDAPPKEKPAADRTEKLRNFAVRFVERAFRRPLTDEQKKLYVDRQFETSKDAEAAIKRVVLLAMKSPRFLYRELAGSADGYDTACRLAFTLWDSMPDEDLLKAAAANQLTTRDQVMKQAERMLTDSRAKAKLRGFLMNWLKVEPIPDIAKDPQRFPGFDLAVVADLRTSLELFLDDVLWSQSSDFRQLLLADELQLNGRLAIFYGAPLPPDPRARAMILTGSSLAKFLGGEVPFQKVKLNPEQRAGVLTHPYLMSAFAYTGSSSPIHRGVFLARGVLGLTMRPPQEAFSPLPENLHPNLTTRERVALQTKPAACISCHGVINPLGFTLEHFDAVGRYRVLDNGKQVDSTGGYVSRTGQELKFAGVRDLAKYLASSDEVHAAFAQQMFHHLAKQPVRAYGTETLDDLRREFAKGGYSVRKLAAEIAVAAALTPKVKQPVP